MLGKLLKYDFRSMLKQFALVWPAALVLGLINRFTIKHFVTSSTLAGEIVSGSAMLVYVFILISMFILSVIFMIQRFYKGLLRDEGYLMHTLPVRPWQLITAKLLCAMTVVIISFLVAVLSGLLIFPLEWQDYLGAFRAFWDSVRAVSQFYLGQTILVFVEFLLFLLLNMASRFLQMYQSMAIGHLFGKNRILMSVVAFMAIDTAMGVVTSLMGVGVFSTGLLDKVANSMTAADSASAIFGVMHGVLWIGIGYAAVWTAVFFLGTNYILKRKLNLE